MSVRPSQPIESPETSVIMPSWASDLPQEWTWSRLDQVCIEIVDCPHSTPEVVDDGPYLMARTSDVLGGVFRADEARRVSEASYRERIRRAEPTSGDLLYSREGTYFGLAAEVPSNTKVCLGQRMVLLRPDPVRAQASYLRHWLNGPGMQIHIHGHRDGSVAERLNLSTIRGLPICTPPLREQHAIAHVLGTLDDKIELNRRMNETLEALARALFKSWFVDFDPVRAKAEGRDPGLPRSVVDLFPDRLVDSELGEIPEGWSLKPLDRVAHFQNGLALQRFRPRQGEERLPVVKIAQLRRGSADSNEWASTRIRPECIIYDGDVVFSWSGSLLVTVWCGGRAALNQHLFKVTSEEFPRWFYLHAILSHLPEFQRIASGKATTMGHIQRQHLTEALCVVPDRNLLQQISPVFDTLDERWVASKTDSRTLAVLRDELLPKLISGELRIRDAEKLLSWGVA